VLTDKGRTAAARVVATVEQTAQTRAPAARRRALPKPIVNWGEMGHLNERV
jgi:hypothetical protein